MGFGEEHFSILLKPIDLIFPPWALSTLILEAFLPTYTIHGDVLRNVKGHKSMLRRTVEI